MTPTTLLHRAQQGDPDALERLLTLHARLIASIARRYAGRVPLEDLTQEGRVAFLGAVRSFDAGKGLRFSTHLGNRVRGAILHYLRDKAAMIRVPAWAQEAGQSAPLVFPIEEREEPESAGGQIEDRMAVRETLLTLPRQEQAALWAVGVEGRTCVEAGETMGIAPQVVHRHYQNGKRHFRDAYMGTP